MKRVSGYILCVLVAAAYVFSYMGVGIHTCHGDGSRHLVWLLGDVSCEAIHHHSHGEDHQHSHDGHCCTTQVFVLTDAQDSAPDHTSLSAPEMPLPQLAEAVTVSPVIPGHPIILSWDSPPPIAVLSQSILSVWLV
ncbi:MAG: hypothetical protein J5702_02095 [Bacteroidales bacterium]|nr:hypothetical protein [Bacteroidales bacterium]